jgi:hypothetical protein
MRIVLTIIAVLMVLSGLLWIGQGTGAIPWPANSFMINERPWVLRGAILAILGAALFWFARRRRK